MRGGMTALRRIVVGVDGSEYSWRPSRWAVVDACRHGADELRTTAVLAPHPR